MSGALRDTVRMEARRLRTARVTLLLAGLAVVAGAVIALMIALVSPPGTELAPTRTTALLAAGGDALPLSMVGGVCALLGVVTVGHDYRFGLLRAVLVAQPRRGVVVAARVLVLGVTALGLAVVVSLVGTAVAWLVGRPPAHDPTTLRAAAAHAGLAVLWAWLGAGLCWVLRSTAGSVALLLLGPLLVEPVIALAAGAGDPQASPPAVRWLPFAAARQALGRQLWADADTIGALAGAADFAVVTLVVLALAWVLVSWRDA